VDPSKKVPDLNCEVQHLLLDVVSGKSGPKDQVALHYYYYFAFALVHDSRGIEIVNFTISLALSAGTLMASAGILRTA